MELHVRGLAKSYGGVPVLRDVTFDAGPGFTCVEAPSGAGKTTLLRLVLGLEKPDGGLLTGVEHARFSAVFQESRLLPGTAERNLRFVLGGGYDEARAALMLLELGLHDAAEKRVEAYSGGMCRRLALARALLVPFDVLVLDEPFAGLDAGNRQRAAECIRRRAKGRIVLLAVHDRAEAAGLEGPVVTLGDR
jgi:NitT/TauT family transport system ATP-binding protein